MKYVLVLLTVIAAEKICHAQHSPDNSNPTTMKSIEHVYPVFVTSKLEETVNFYVERFAFNKIFESTFFVLLMTGGEHPFSVAFMDEKHPTSPPTPKAMKGDGAFLTIQVSDAKDFFDTLKKEGFQITYPLADEPWGQRRFGFVDPNGMWVDVVQQTAPVEGYWDKYIR